MYQRNNNKSEIMMMKNQPILSKYKALTQKLSKDKDFIMSKEYLTNNEYLEDANDMVVLNK